MPQPEEPERQEQQRQEDDVAGREQEDQQGDRQTNRNRADHSPHRFVGDAGTAPPTVLNRSVARTA
jgi:hypothetical protein